MASDNPEPRRWAVHPPPLPDETLTSWLTRVARANAATLSSWLAAEYSSAVWRQREKSLDTHDSPELWARLAERAALDVATVRAMSFCELPPRASSWLLADGRSPTDRLARWCPRCLETDAIPYFRRAWNWEWVAWCPEDGTRLRDACRHCGAMLRYRKVPWDRALTECWRCRADIACGPYDEAPCPAFVRSETIEALRSLGGITPDDVDALWSLGRFVRLVGWGRDRTVFVPPPFIAGADFGTTYPAVSPEAVATTFAIAWHLHAGEQSVVGDLARRHQGRFNQATAYRCPDWMRAFRRAVLRRLDTLTTEGVREAIDHLRANQRTINYESVAAMLDCDAQSITHRPVWRALVDAAAPCAVGPRMRLRPSRRRSRNRVQPHWFASMAAGVAAARAALTARGERLSRAAIAREIGVTADVVRRFEDAAQEPLTRLMITQRQDQVRQAVAALRDRGARVTTLGVARELGWDRNTIEDRAELKAIVQESKVPPLTAAAVSAAIDALCARGERATASGVSRELGRGRHEIGRSPDLRALVKIALARQRREMSRRESTPLAVDASEKVGQQ